MNKTISHILLIFSIIYSIIATSCRKEPNFDQNIKNLKFSNDSVIFDTVFTTIGTVTKRLKVYNPSSNWIKIDEIKLAGGAKSNFRINIDGDASSENQNIEIAPNDSLFIFVSATIDPNNQSTPLIVSDSIIFNINGNQQNVKLVAWGQDAYYHIPKETIKGTTIRYSYAGCKKPWKNDKPHVIYGYLVVDTDSTLEIPAGTKIYMHNNAVLWVFEGGSLQINPNGNVDDEKVIIQGTRRESYYKDIAGQWGAIWLSKGSKNNIIQNTEIKNGTIGIQVDTLGSSSSPTLTIKNSLIKNMSSIGILGQGTNIKAENCVISNCAEHALALTIGGEYEFLHCTIANYWNESSGKKPSILISNYYVDINNTTQLRAIKKAYFGNCIIYGNQENEIFIDETNKAEFNYTFENCLLKIDPSINTVNKHYIQNIKNTDPLFTNTNIADYRLKLGSPAIDKGKISIGLTVPMDMNGNNRTSDNAPDIGAYEFKSE